MPKAYRSRPIMQIDNICWITIHFRMDLSQLDWNHLKAFHATAETGSFSAAAKALNTTQPTISRQIAALEQSLSLVLFERVGHTITLTPAAKDMLHALRTMQEAATSLERSAISHAQEMAGSVTLTATGLFASRILPPILRKLRMDAPEIHIEILPSNDWKNLQRREADIAIRNARPTENELIGTRLKDAVGRFYAARSLIEQTGPIAHPLEAKGAPFIDLDEATGFYDFLVTLGLPVTPADLPIKAEDHNVMWELVRAGLGIGPCDERIGDADPDVVRVLTDLPPIPFPVWLLVHRDVKHNKRVRYVFDYLTREMGVAANTA